MEHFIELLVDVSTTLRVLYLCIKHNYIFRVWGYFKFLLHKHSLTNASSVFLGCQGTVNSTKQETNNQEERQTTGEFEN